MESKVAELKGFWALKNLGPNLIYGTTSERLDFYSVGNFSKYFPSGSIRIQVNSHNGDLLATGFLNPNGTRTVIVMKCNLMSLPKSSPSSDGNYNSFNYPHH